MRLRPDVLDWLYRLVYRHGSQIALAWWWLGRPDTFGAHVAIGHDGRVILLRRS